MFVDQFKFILKSIMAINSLIMIVELIAFVFFFSDVMKIFVAEVMKMKEDLEFYLPEQRILFHKNSLIKVHEIFKAMRVI